LSARFRLKSDWKYLDAAGPPYPFSIFLITSSVNAVVVAAPLRSASALTKV